MIDLLARVCLFIYLMFTLIKIVPHPNCTPAPFFRYVVNKRRIYRTTTTTTTHIDIDIVVVVVDQYDDQISNLLFSYNDYYL
jgi:hypothetical protein